MPHDGHDHASLASSAASGMVPDMAAGAHDHAGCADGACAPEAATRADVVAFDAV